MSTENLPRVSAIDKPPGEKLTLPGSTIGGEVGTFYVDFTVWNREGTRAQTLHGLVDTGALYPQAPAAILEDLGVEREFSEVFRLADGTRLELAVGLATIELEGQRRSVYTIFGPEGSSVLLGALALETFALAADARNQCLVPADLTL